MLLGGFVVVGGPAAAHRCVQGFVFVGGVGFAALGCLGGVPNVRGGGDAVLELGGDFKVVGCVG